MRWSQQSNYQNVQFGHENCRKNQKQRNGWPNKHVYNPATPSPKPAFKNSKIPPPKNPQIYIAVAISTNLSLYRCMRTQVFGFNEKAWTDEQWLEIAKSLKQSPYVRLRNLRMIYEAEHQSARFSRIALASGAFFFLVFLKFPVLRIQPGFRRVGLSGGFAYGIYNYVDGIAEELKIKRIKTAYRKTIVSHHGHHRVTI